MFASCASVSAFGRMIKGCYGAPSMTVKDAEEEEIAGDA